MDSPRWCDICEAWGDHHTDRHDEATQPHCQSCGDRFNGCPRCADENGVK